MCLTTVESRLPALVRKFVVAQRQLQLSRALYAHTEDQLQRFLAIAEDLAGELRMVYRLPKELDHEEQLDS